MSTLRPFRFIPEGAGGIFRYNASSSEPTERIEHVGTAECETCVGVYFRTDDDRCFVGHIAASVKDEEDGSHSFLPTPEIGEDLRREIAEFLTRSATTEDWTYSKQQMRAEAVIVCPHEYNSQGQKQTGWYVIRALEDFLECPGALRPRSDAHGFIASVQHGLVTYLSHDPVKHSAMAPVESVGWREVFVPRAKWMGIGLCAPVAGRDHC